MKTTLETNLKHITTTFLCAAGMAALVLAPAPRIWAQDASALSGVLGQLQTESQSSADTTLKSLGGELGTKAQALSTSLAGKPDLQNQITGALQSLLGPKGADSLAAFQKLSTAKLTPDQMKLAKDFGHVGSAYLVQKNLGSLDGSQTDVAQIVSSLHKGNVSAVLPAIQKVSQSAKLTPEQKDLLKTLADKYAPGVKKAGDAINGGMNSLPKIGN